MKFQCKECGKFFGQITGKHVKTHGFDTVSQYLEKYPGTATVRARKDSLATLERKRLARTGKTHTAEAKAKIGLKHRGKTRTPEEIAKWRESYRQYLNQYGSPMLGKDRGAAFKKKMSEIAKARPKELVDAKVKMMLEARRGSKASAEQRDRYSAARLKYMAENPDKLPRQMFNTVPELEFEAELAQRGILFERSVHIRNRVFDFKILPNILIEIDGPYHRRLGMYISMHATDDEKIEKLMNIIERDKRKDMMARELGYLVYRIPVGQHIPNNWYEILKNQGFVEF